jgi:hypothetical protein
LGACGAIASITLRWSGSPFSKAPAGRLAQHVAADAKFGGKLRLGRQSAAAGDVAAQDALAEPVDHHIRQSPGGEGAGGIQSEGGFIIEIPK